MSTNVKVGDRIDLTLRGAEVIDVNARGEYGGLRVTHPGAYLPEVAYFSATNSADVEVEVLKPPAPEWVQGDVVVVNPGLDYSFVLFRLEGGRWACSKERGSLPSHDHDDDQVNRYLDTGRGTALIAAGKVVTTG
jgi:hypothetical protein